MSADSLPREMLITADFSELRRSVAAARHAGQIIGCVPTMGALHAGHISLMQQAHAECDFVIATLFVNPTQFGPQEDLQKYPRPFEADCDKCRVAGVDLLFHPSVESIYPPGYSTFVEVEGLTTKWEGAVRPTHFRGVTTVVAKLLNLTQPDKAYFGQKDFQQQAIIRRMCRDLDMPTEIVTCPTVRDPDGLALSSRNAYLNVTERASGLSLYRALCLARDKVRTGEKDLAAIRLAMRAEMEQTPGVAVDYATIADPDSLVELNEPQPRMVALVAARVGPTRLIDNLLIP
ncbi:pantothenate synthetase [Planctomycetia bacterium]|nr:pantothenate synthetase [Planctomycetia bacterium]